MYTDGSDSSKCDAVIQTDSGYVPNFRGVSSCQPTQDVVSRRDPLQRTSTNLQLSECVGSDCLQCTLCAPGYRLIGRHADLVVMTVSMAFRASLRATWASLASLLSLLRVFWLRRSSSASARGVCAVSRLAWVADQRATSARSGRTRVPKWQAEVSRGAVGLSQSDPGSRLLDSSLSPTTTTTTVRRAVLTVHTISTGILHTRCWQFRQYHPL